MMFLPIVLKHIAAKISKILFCIMMSFYKAVSTHSTEYAPLYLMIGGYMRLPSDADLIPNNKLWRNTKQYLED